jgi:hypothetical protein
LNLCLTSSCFWNPSCDSLDSNQDVATNTCLLL